MSPCHPSFCLSWEQGHGNFPFLLLFQWKHFALFNVPQKGCIMRVIKPPRKRFFPFLAKAFPLQLNLTVRSFLSFLYTALGLSPWRVGCVFPCMALLSFMAVFSTLWCYCCFCCSASSFFLLQGHSALCWKETRQDNGYQSACKPLSYIWLILLSQRVLAETCSMAEALQGASGVSCRCSGG